MIGYGAMLVESFVAIMALAYSYANFHVLNDRPFAVIWLYWAFLWFLFFLLLGLKREHLTVYTGWVTAIEGWVTGADVGIAADTPLGPLTISYGVATGGSRVFKLRIGG